jgi:hypothetical protein
MSTNPVLKAIDEAGSAFAKGVKFIAGLEDKAKTFVSTVKEVDPNLKAELQAFVTDTENFIAEVSAAASSEGVNFSVDSAAFAAFLKVKNDVLTLAAAFVAAEKAL